jgi:hypothetical protein
LGSQCGREIHRLISVVIMLEAFSHEDTVHTYYSIVLPEVGSCENRARHMRASFTRIGIGELRGSMVDGGFKLKGRQVGARVWSWSKKGAGPGGHPGFAEEASRSARSTVREKQGTLGVILIGELAPPSTAGPGLLIKHLFCFC